MTQYKTVMGLDASTSTIGLSILAYDEKFNIKLIHKEYFKPPKKGNLFERLYKTRQYILNKMEEFCPNIVAIEDIIKYMGKNSTAQTTTILSAFNRCVGLAVYESSFNVPPYLYSVSFIRNIIKLNKEVPIKEEIPELVSEIIGFEWDYFLNRAKNIAEENFDVADSIAVALCYIKIEQFGLSHEPEKKKPKKKKIIKKPRKKKIIIKKPQTKEELKAFIQSKRNKKKK